MHCISANGESDNHGQYGLIFLEQNRWNFCNAVPYDRATPRVPSHLHLKQNHQCLSVLFSLRFRLLAGNINSHKILYFSAQQN